MPTFLSPFRLLSSLAARLRAWPSGAALVAIIFLPATLSAQSTEGDGTIVFGPGNTVRVDTFFTSTYPTSPAVRFDATASVNQGVVVNTANVAVTMNGDTSILPPPATAYALRFTSTGGSLVANGATLRASTSGALNFVSAANATLTDTVIDFTPTSASGAAAVLLQNGGTFSATGGSIAYNPAGSLSNVNAALRNSAGSLALSLTDVTVTSGSAPSHRGYGLDLVGGGTVDLLGTTSVTARQAEALRLNGAYTVTNAGTLTTLDASGNDADGAVRLTGGVTSFTNSASGVINGAAASFSADGAIRVNTEASGSTIANAGTIDGITSENTGGYLAALTLTNSGTIATTNRTAVGFGSGSVTNQAGGTISGGASSTGLSVTGGDIDTDFSLTNAGAISGGTAVNTSARTLTVTNQAGGTLTGTAAAGTAYGAQLISSGGSASLTNVGTISGRQGVQITGQGDVASVQNLTVTNSGSLTGTVTQGVRVDGDFAATAARNITITNEVGALIQGGTTTPFSYNIANAAVYAANRGSGTITIDNRGTIDARNQSNAIGVSVSDSVQATITLHTGSTTTGAIRGTNPNNSANAGVTLAFAGTGNYGGDTAGITRYLKSTTGTWTYSGERTGGSVEVTGGTLVFSNRDLGSSVNTTVTNGTLRLSPASPMSAGNLSLNANDLTVGTGGRLEIAATARAAFTGSGGTARVENAGVLLLDGVASFSSNSNFALQVTTNGLLAGTGRSTGFMRIENGGTFDAGNGNLASAGLFRTYEFGGAAGGLTFGDGGLLRWTLASLSETGAGVNFDQIGLDGSTSVTYESGARFGFDFSAFGEGPTAANSFWHSNRSWEFVNGGTVNGGANLLFADTGLATYDFAGVGFFTLAGDGRTLDWTANVTAIPEPSTWALLIGGGALILVLWRRRFTA